MEFRQHSLRQNGFTPHHFSLKKGAGFTLVELLVTIGVFTIVVTVGASALAASRERAEIAAQADILIQLVRETQQRAVVSVAGTAWGVRCDASRLVRFSFAPAAPSIELTSEQFDLPPQFSCATPTALRFEKLTGFVSAASDVTMSYQGVAERRIEVRPPGIVALVTP